MAGASGGTGAGFTGTASGAIIQPRFKSAAGFPAALFFLASTGPGRGGCGRGQHRGGWRVVARPLLNGLFFFAALLPFSSRPQLKGRFF